MINKENFPRAWILCLNFIDASFAFSPTLWIIELSATPSLASMDWIGISGILMFLDCVVSYFFVIIYL